jgi:hypothetical protein
MSNMPYCRFQNTLSDLKDCYDNMDDEDLSEKEARARQRLISICSQIHYDYSEDEE